MSDPLPTLPPRNKDSHKGDYGRALFIGGSLGMAGSISLSGMAALRSGAGLVKLAVPEVVLATVASFEPSYMTVPLSCDAAGRIDASSREQLSEHLTVATCIACGPGLGRSDDVNQLVERLYRTGPQPMVLDADALNALASRPNPFAEAGGPRVFTPHPGEFARLMKSPSKLSDDEAQRRAEAAARDYGIVVVLKGHPTLITDGLRSWRNVTGNPGMATGGTGDVLTGIITALICQGLSPYDAARLGCHVHGLAGDLAAAELGEISLTARDLLTFLPEAYKSLAAQV